MTFDSIRVMRATGKQYAAAATPFTGLGFSEQR